MASTSADDEGFVDPNKRGRSKNGKGSSSRNTSRSRSRSTEHDMKIKAKCLGQDNWVKVPRFLINAYLTPRLSARKQSDVIAFGLDKYVDGFELYDEDHRKLPPDSKDASFMYVSTTLTDLYKSNIWVYCVPSTTAPKTFKGQYCRWQAKAISSRFGLLFGIFPEHLSTLRELSPEFCGDAEDSVIYDKLAAQAQIGEAKYFNEGGGVETDEARAKSVAVPCGIKDKNGSDIYLQCVRNQRDGYWVWSSDKVCGGFFSGSSEFQGIVPSKWLLKWAYIPDRAAKLDELERLALKENWQAVGGQKQFVLVNYLRFTFVRIMRLQKKVGAEAKIQYLVENDACALFNTGLVDDKFEFIYAYFVKNTNPGMQKWSFSKFLRQSDKPDESRDRTLKSIFTKDGVNTLPRPVYYFSPKWPIHFCFYDPLSPLKYVTFNEEHIIKERFYRMPVEFLMKSFGKDETMKTLLKQLPSDVSGFSLHQWSIIESIKEEIKKHQDLFNECVQKFKEILENSLRKAVWNYRTIIPYYYPATDSILFLLPLYLDLHGEPCAALVLQQTAVDRSGKLVDPESGDAVHHYRYEGHTIITLEMCYLNARLVSRLEGGWLDPENKP